MKEHHLEVVTKAAQLEETERRKRLDQQRNNCSVAPEQVYTHKLGNKNSYTMSHMQIIIATNGSINFLEFTAYEDI